MFNMRVLVYSVPILLCFLVSTVICQDEDSEGAGVWEMICNRFKRWFQELREALNKMKDEFTARMKDMGDLTQEMWDQIKQKLYHWVNSQNDLDEYQKMEMRKDIERMQMPPTERSK